MKPKPSSGTGMLSAAAGKPKAVGLAPPPGSGKIRSPLPPPPNDPVAARLGTSNHSVDPKVSKDNSRHAKDSLSDLSPFEVCLIVNAIQLLAYRMSSFYVHCFLHISLAV